MVGQQPGEGLVEEQKQERHLSWTLSIAWGLDAERQSFATPKKEAEESRNIRVQGYRLDSAWIKRPQ